MLRPGAMLGRQARERLPLGRVTGRAYGDAGSPDLDINSDTRGAPAAYPGHGGGTLGLGEGNWGSTSFGGIRMDPRQQPGPFPDGIGGPGGAYGGGWADGVLTVRDRHVITRQGYVRNPAGGGSSMPSPDMDGPPQRQYQMVNSTESWQIGTDLTTNEDNQGEHYQVDAIDGSGRKFRLGTQDGTLTRVMGPPLGSYREYGVRGPQGMHGPAPDEWDPNWIPHGRTAGGSGGAGGRGQLVAEGAPGMQPQDARFVYGGVPHGLHSPTIASQVFTAARQRSIIQQQPPRMDRPASSKAAGQSYSQTVVPEAQAGAMRAMPRQASPGRTPGLRDRFAPRG